MISQTEIETLLKDLCRDQLVNLGVGTTANRGWFRAKVVAHEASAGRLVLTYDMDRPTDRILEPGERVIVSAMRMYDEAQSAPMSVAHSTGGPRRPADSRQPRPALVQRSLARPGRDRG
jgi:hypothetical protein